MLTNNLQSIRVSPFAFLPQDVRQVLDAPMISCLSAGKLNHLDLEKSLRSSSSFEVRVFLFLGTDSSSLISASSSAEKPKAYRPHMQHSRCFLLHIAPGITATVSVHVVQSTNISFQFVSASNLCLPLVSVWLSCWRISAEVERQWDVDDFGYLETSLLFAEPPLHLWCWLGVKEEELGSSTLAGIR
jgi:hypothetical protein